MSRLEDIKAMELRLQHQLQENATLRSQISGIKSRTAGGSPSVPVTPFASPISSPRINYTVGRHPPLSLQPSQGHGQSVTPTAGGARNIRTPTRPSRPEDSQLLLSPQQRETSPLSSARTASVASVPSKTNYFTPPASIFVQQQQLTPRRPQSVHETQTVPERTNEVKVKLVTVSTDATVPMYSKDTQCRPTTRDSATDMRLFTLRHSDAIVQTVRYEPVPMGGPPMVASVPSTPRTPQLPTRQFSSSQQMSSFVVTPKTNETAAPYSIVSPMPPAPMPMDVLEERDRDWIQYVEHILANRPLRAVADKACTTEGLGPSEDLTKLKYLVHQYEDMVLGLTEAMDRKTVELKDVSDLNRELRVIVERVETELNDIRIKGIRVPMMETADVAAKEEYIKRLQEEMDAYEIAVNTEWSEREKRFAHEIRATHDELDTSKRNTANYRFQCESMTREMDDLRTRLVANLQSEVAQKDHRAQELLTTQRDLSNAVLEKQDELSNARLMLLQNDSIDTSGMQNKFHLLVAELKAEYQRLYEERNTREHEEMSGFYRDTKQHMDAREVICSELSEILRTERAEKSRATLASEAEVAALRRESSILTEEMNSALTAVITQLEHKSRQVSHLMEVLHLNRGYQDALQLSLTKEGGAGLGSAISLEEHTDLIKIKDSEIQHLRETLHSEVSRQMDELRDVQVQFERYDRSIKDVERQLADEKGRHAYHLQVECGRSALSPPASAHPQSNVPPHAHAAPFATSFASKVKDPQEMATMTAPVGHLPSTSHSTLYDLLYRERR